MAAERCRGQRDAVRLRGNCGGEIKDVSPAHDRLAVCCCNAHFWAGETAKGNADPKAAACSAHRGGSVNWMALSLSAVTFAATHPRWLLARLRGLSVDVSLDVIARHISSAPIIVEAGACDGRDTVAMAELWPAGFIHAFEPVPIAYDTLQQRARHLKNVRTYPLALSDSVGPAELHLSEDESGADRPDSSSLLAPTAHLDTWPTIAFRTTLTVQTTTLDHWASEHGVMHVDLMWLDMQGLELRALQAAPALLARTRAVYMEVFRVPLYDGAPTYSQVVPWMRQIGFRLVIDRVSRVAGNALFVRANFSSRLQT